MGLLRLRNKAYAICPFTHEVALWDLVMVELINDEWDDKKKGENEFL